MTVTNSRLSPREALHLLESLRDVQRALARPEPVPGMKSALARELAALRAAALTMAIDALRAKAKGGGRRPASPKELSL